MKKIGIFNLLEYLFIIIALIGIRLAFVGYMVIGVSIVLITIILWEVHFNIREKKK